jgi:hypothetical protein
MCSAPAPVHARVSTAAGQTSDYRGGERAAADDSEQRDARTVQAWAGED